MKFVITDGDPVKFPFPSNVTGLERGAATAEINPFEWARLGVSREGCLVEAARLLTNLFRENVGMDITVRYDPRDEGSEEGRFYVQVKAEYVPARDAQLSKVDTAIAETTIAICEAAKAAAEKAVEDGIALRPKSRTWDDLAREAKEKVYAEWNREMYRKWEMAKTSKIPYEAGGLPESARDLVSAFEDRLCANCGHCEVRVDEPPCSMCLGYGRKPSWIPKKCNLKVSPGYPECFCELDQGHSGECRCHHQVAKGETYNARHNIKDGTAAKEETK